MEILIVDSDPDDTAIYEEILLLLDNTNRITIVKDGIEALSILRSSHYRPDLVLLDHDLPTMLGWEFLKKVRMEPGIEGLFVVVLSTVCSDQHLKLFNSLGADCQTKPVELGEIEDLLKRILESVPGKGQK